MSSSREAVDHGPARLSGAVSAGVALLTASAVGWYSLEAFGVGAVGAAVLVAGLVIARRTPLVVGAVGLVAGVLLGGIRGAPVWALLVGIAGAIIAWDAADTALVLGRQLCPAARTRRVELVHLSGTLLTASLAAGVGYGVYRVATGGQPVAALLLLLLAGALLVRALAE